MEYRWQYTSLIGLHRNLRHEWGSATNTFHLFESTGGHTVVIRKYVEWGFQHACKYGVHAQTQIFPLDCTAAHTKTYHYWHILECICSACQNLLLLETNRHQDECGMKNLDSIWVLFEIINTIRSTMPTSCFLAIKLSCLDLLVCHVYSFSYFFWFPFFESPDHLDWFDLPGRQCHYGRSTCQENPCKFHIITTPQVVIYFLTYQVFAE